MCPLPPQTAAGLPAYDMVQDEAGLPSYDVVDNGDAAAADYEAPGDNTAAATEYEAPADNMVYAAAEYAAPAAADKPSAQPDYCTPAPLAPSAPATGRGGMAGDCAPDDAASVYGMNYGAGGVGALADGFGALELPPVPAHLQVAGQPSTPPVRVAPTHVADESIYETPNDDVFHDFAYFWPSTQREQAEVLLPRVSALLPTPHVLQFDSGWPAGLVVRRIPPCMCVGGLTV